MKTEHISFKVLISGNKKNESISFSDIKGFHTCHGIIFRDKEGLNLRVDLFKTRLNLFDKIKRFFK